MNVLIVDCKLNNIGSVERALQELGANPIVAEHPHHLPHFSHMILPGVGSYAAGMRALSERGWPDFLRQKSLLEGIPLLGICLGMQLLTSLGEEGGQTPGLNLIPGKTLRLQPRSKAEKIPHVGWNDISFMESHPLLEGIQSETDFYFVHSYQVQPEQASAVLATSSYCGGFPAIISNSGTASEKNGQYGKIFGTQFHPEKSSRPGIRLLKNFVFNI